MPSKNKKMSGETGCLEGLNSKPKFGVCCQIFLGLEDVKCNLFNPFHMFGVGLGDVMM